MLFNWLRKLFRTITAPEYTGPAPAESPPDPEWLDVPQELGQLYMDTCFVKGPSHPETLALRKKHAAVPYFLEYADHIDDLKCAVMGQGYLSIPVIIRQRYMTCCFRNGPDHPETARLREQFADVPLFPACAKAIDSLKWAVGGSGIEWPPGQEPPQ